jgi:hypothetical protein
VGCVVALIAVAFQKCLGGAPATSTSVACRDLQGEHPHRRINVHGSHLQGSVTAGTNVTRRGVVPPNRSGAEPLRKATVASPPTALREASTRLRDPRSARPLLASECGPNGFAHPVPDRVRSTRGRVIRARRTDQSPRPGVAGARGQLRREGRLRGRQAGGHLSRSGGADPALGRAPGRPRRATRRPGDDLPAQRRGDARELPRHPSRGRGRSAGQPRVHELRTGLSPGRQRGGRRHHRPGALGRLPALAVPGPRRAPVGDRRHTRARVGPRLPGAHPDRPRGTRPGRSRPGRGGMDVLHLRDHRRAEGSALQPAQLLALGGGELRTDSGAVGGRPRAVAAAVVPQPFPHRVRAVGNRGRRDCPHHGQPLRGRVPGGGPGNPRHLCGRRADHVSLSSPGAAGAPDRPAGSADRAGRGRGRRSQAVPVVPRGFRGAAGRRVRQYRDVRRDHDEPAGRRPRRRVVRASGARCRCPDRRPGDRPRRQRRRRGRGVGTRPERDVRLPQQTGGDRGGVPGRLVSHG